jgi:biopolymer transport protein ExbB/TolQ
MRGFVGICVLALAASVTPAQEQPKTRDIPLDKIEDVTATEADALSEQMEDLEEGDLKTFRVVTDDNIAALALGDIYKSNQSFFKVKAIRKQSSAGGVFVMERLRGRMEPAMKWNRVSGEGPLTVTSRQTLMDRYWSGGPVMHFISAEFFVFLIVLMRCLFIFRERLHCPEEFSVKCAKAIEAGDLTEFETLSVKQRGLLAHTCRVMVANFRRLTIDEIKSRVEAEAVHELGRLQLPLRIINFVATTAPLLGLLGTVTGIITCFEALAGETASQSKAMTLAAGIKEALLTTAYGLIVAVPALTAYFVLHHRLTQIANLCGVTGEEFLHELAVLRREAGTAAGELDSGKK